jgi:hypothetical protein
MFFQHYGRGSDAKGIHFYQTIQLRHLQDQELVSIIDIHLFYFLFCIISLLTKKIKEPFLKPSDDGIYWRLGGKMLGFPNTTVCSQCVC